MNFLKETSMLGEEVNIKCPICGAKDTRMIRKGVEDDTRIIKLCKTCHVDMVIVEDNFFQKMINKLMG